MAVRRAWFAVRSAENRLPQRRAFTLIELLVVVGIIGLLIAIIVPSLSRARSSAKRAACASNLRQVGIAVRAYISSTNDRFPYASMMPSFGPAPLETPAPIYIADVLAREMSDQQNAWRCPNDPGEIERPPPNVGKSYFATERSSYEYQVRLAWRTLEEYAKRFNEFTGLAVNPNDIWIFRDYNNFHAKGGQPGARRYLYGDGRVTDFEM